MFKHLPNSLTLLRLALAFVFPFAPEQYRLLIVAVALATEYFDGALSRWFNLQTPLGALLDPIADKCFVFSVALVIFIETDMTWWQFILFGAREIAVFCGAAFIALEKNWRAFFNVVPRILGKITTVFQFLVFLSFVGLQVIPQWLLVLTITLSVCSAFDYIYLFVKNNFYRNMRNV
ncbi:CDP-alcohol phosphatidyltransferase family protein [Nitrosomonas sp.]|uniref:CDP-alcohol phosphatidyltransferase family protein n=1 Tax=Nitrosomonas sp. TaxID=42353 RepID=UPI001D553606|nr:CDP-alcohol phosphatidyltransferase family protein [Nitrosomonas sp.]MCB1948574.1 CDP-alcohol phosphatidyltransferase family protein [Nitrosomonas sp.]